MRRLQAILHEIRLTSTFRKVQEQTSMEPAESVEVNPPIIFVFGSNLAGRHGKGAALDAVRLYGAIYGMPVGRQGQSYAIPTKDKQLNPLPIHKIKGYVDSFLEYARQHPELVFSVTRIGCGLAGYKNEDIAPLFKDRLRNVILHQDWRFILDPTLSYRVNHET